MGVNIVFSIEDALNLEFEAPMYVFCMVIVSSL